ncbi:MAG: DUF3089 domain-containing protein [Myxococcales bacterium]|nr:DUF3089 domain-containing protein [Myxococcales bacterium]
MRSIHTLPRTTLLFFSLGLAFASALAGCDVRKRCTPLSASPNYADKASWACRPDVSGDACDGNLTAVEVLPNGLTEIVQHQPAASPKIDCFYIYPTVDLNPLPGLHQDIQDKAAPYKTIGIQAARLSEVCRVFAPLYRQVTIGTYLSSADERSLCFDVAYDDVHRAFEQYLQNDNQGRGFVIYGHSQGAQITSRLVRERIETDPAVRARLVAALPIGWLIGTDAAGSTGGSFKSIPVCKTKSQIGCVMGYRTYAAGNPFPTDAGDYREGAAGVCTLPPDPALAQTTLSRSFFPSDLDSGGKFPASIASQAPYVLYRRMYKARCISQGDMKGMEIALAAEVGDARQNPLDFSSLILSSTNGTHVLDVQFTEGDLIDTIAAKAAAYAP